MVPEHIVRPEIGDYVNGRCTFAVVLLCGLTILAEGYDIGIMGAVLLALKDDPHWSLSPVQLGWLSSSALVGMLFGAMIVGTLADRLSRKRLLIACFLIFSLANLGCAISPNPWIFAAFRAIGGLGMGGLIPTAAALTIEYSRLEARSRNYGIMYSGYSLGICLVAVISVPVLADGSWRTLFWIGALPLVLTPFLFRYLPDSYIGLVTTGKNDEADMLATRLGVSPEDRLLLARRTGAGQQQLPAASVRSLFDPRYIRATICFWLALALGLLLVYGMGSWLPTLMRAQGYALGSSLSSLAIFSIASALGGIFAGTLADRFGERRVISLSFLVAAIASLGLAYGGSLVWNYIFVALAGYGTVSTTLVLTGYATAWYPVSIRATAIGWALGFGRIGAICGPVLSGYLLALLNGNVTGSLVAYGVVAILACVLVLGIPRSPNIAKAVPAP